MITEQKDKDTAVGTTMRCLVRYIVPGQSDAVLYISPAEQANETVDTSIQAGTERKEEIDRIIHLHAPRVGIIPKPAKLMDGDGGVGGGQNLRNRTLADADIPEIKLEGFVFPKPKVAERKRLPAEAFKGDVAMSADRMDKMEKNIDMLTTTIGSLNTVISNLTKIPTVVASVGDTTVTTSPTPDAPPAPTGHRGRPKKGDK